MARFHSKSLNARDSFTGGNSESTHAVLDAMIDGVFAIISVFAEHKVLVDDIVFADGSVFAVFNLINLGPEFLHTASFNVRLWVVLAVLTRVLLGKILTLGSLFIEIPYSTLVALGLTLFGSSSKLSFCVG